MSRSNLGRILAFILILTCIFPIMIPSATAASDSSKGLKITGSKVVAVGKSVTLKASQKSTWKSSNKKIATVSKKGVVKGKKAGTVKITATATDGSKKTWKMKVYAKPVKSVKITASTTELDLNGTKTVKLKAKASPSKAAQSFTWKSSNKKIATVSSSGKVTAKSEGTVKITATADDGSKKKATITITVKNSETHPAVTGKIGISMPTDALQRWANDGSRMRNGLVNTGNEVVLEYADNNVNTQIAQIEKMIGDKCDVLIIAPIEASSLSGVLSKAKENGIRIIAFDRLILNTDAVSYYLTFNNSQVGKLQGNYIKNKLSLDSAAGPFYLEITSGDSNDGNAKVFFNGAMSVLKPYISNGKLIVKSGQTEFSDVATDGWRTDKAQERAASIINDFYGDGSNIDAWLCSNDSTALGVTNALNDSYAGSWPIITGQDCDLQNVRNIIAGKQAMSVFKDTRMLADKAVSMVKDILNGSSVETDGSTNNNTINVPTCYCNAVAVDKSNYWQYLIESGIYTEDDLK